jgi:hypothetical protein
VIVVGCLIGGTDGESNVTVIGFQPGVDLPDQLLSENCGVTSWKLSGSHLVIHSQDLKSGGAQPSALHPDVVFQWQGGDRFNSGFGFTISGQQSEGLNNPPFCHTF